MDLTNLCNYSFGNYSVTDNDSISFYNVGEGTEKYCLSDKSMDWETLYINSLISAETYSITENKLTLNCRDYKLVFDFIFKYDSYKEKVLAVTLSL